MRIALIVDNPFRDLPGIVLVAQRLCREGITCYLVPSNLEWREIGALSPDFVLLPNLRRPRQEFASRLIDAGVKVGVLETEGGVMTSMDRYKQMTSPDTELYARVSAFCSWGPHVANYVTEQGWYQPQQVQVTGAPRFDFYSQRWRPSALRASMSLEKFPSPLILINGSFPRANPRFLTQAQERESWQGLGFSLEFIEHLQQVEEVALRKMAELANHLAKRFPQATVVYRPHPFEKAETYELLLTKRDNLHLAKIGTVEGWILRANVIIHRNSTTAIEAAMAGLPALLPEWIRVAETLETCDAVSIKCQTTDEIDQYVQSALNKSLHRHPELESEISRVLHKWFYEIDGNAHERVAEAIFKHANGSSTFGVSNSKCRRIHYGWRPHALQLRSRLAIGSRMSLGIPVTWSFSEWGHRDPGVEWLQSEKMFDVAKVSALLESLNLPAESIAIGFAQSKTDYRNPYDFGRSVVMRSVN